MGAAHKIYIPRISCMREEKQRVEMGSQREGGKTGKPHAVLIPYPAQGHITPLLKFAKLLHSRGFHVTFVNTEYNHRRLLNSRDHSFLTALPDFVFEAIPDGLPEAADDELDVTQDIPQLCYSITTTCLAPFQRLLAKLNDPSSGVPPVTCIISDAVMSFTLDAAELLGVPVVLLWTASASGFLGYFYFKELVRRGVVPVKDAKLLGEREFMETKVEGVPGLEGVRFKDFPSFARTDDMDDIMLNFILNLMSRIPKAKAIAINTFDDLDRSILDVMAEGHPPIYTIGPLNLLCKEKPERLIGSNLWKEELTGLRWLQGKPPSSVVYVNFGSIAVMTNEQLGEFAWGLAGSGHDFLWVIRPDLAGGEPAVLPEGFVEETKGRGVVGSWAPQEEVLRQPAIGAFLTHCGWNSILESISCGVPMACWPFFAEQQTNCRFICAKWGIGVEIDGDVRREEVESLVRELMDGESGKKMREEALKWKEKGTKAAMPEGGSSFRNLESLVRDVLLLPK